jgi:beta-lactamase regulating signal transducer with metallopeptidase domain
MTDWLLDTLVWTALLIGLVLLVRRPVARWFGPQIAYALWALPMIRLLLPPIELPRWLAPAEPATLFAPPTGASLPDFDPETPVATQTVFAGPAMEPGAAATDAAMRTTPQSLFELTPWLELGLSAWLVGAAIFLAMRFSAYFRLRAQLLAEAREVGRAGQVRLVETPATAAPLAFGVLDPVIALPPGFMALTNRTARDLALAHELEHHRGRDLLINVLVQPLFALHWWNPLGRYGWLALRRDQEAACDARVVAARSAEERAVYAKVIAGFAAGPNLTPRTALTAPMACPVLGDKSIIQRLRSLTMSDLSPRRRIAGRTLLGVAVLALPLTASISYAANEVVSEVPEAPEPPAPPSSPEAPMPPAPPAPPQIIAIDPSGETEVIESEDGRTIIKRERSEDGDVTTEKRVKIIKRGDKLSDVDIEALEEGVRVALSEADKQLKDLPTIMRNAMVNIDLNGAEGQRTIIKMECRGNDDEVAKVEAGENGRSTVFFCKSRVMAKALEGLKEAREEVARDRHMSEEIRERMLKQFDEMIEAWGKRKG